MLKGKFVPFFQKASFCVEQKRPKRRSNPEIKITDEALFLSLKLAKAGWMGGDPKKVLKSDADTVINMIYYEGFENDLMDAYEDLRKDESS